MTIHLAKHVWRAVGPWCVGLGILTLLAPAALIAQHKATPRRSQLQEKADEIRASADSLFKLRRIPWVTDPAEGFRLAREENRPVFFYLQAGDPLEDC